MSVAAIAWDALAEGPGEYRTPERRPSLDESKEWCKKLATSHYENFHVATFFLPKRVKPHFESIYAYCRVSDDLGDEVSDPAAALRLLDAWGAMLDECYDAPEHSRHPVFVALRETIVSTGVPRELFANLLRAFRQDQVKPHYESVAELLEYSQDSANPVGRLVLWVCGYREEMLGVLSDKVCTALQLANFWQDVVEDDERGRRYLPADEMRRFDVTDEQIRSRRFTPDFWRLMQSLVEQTRTMLHEGGAISGLVDKELAATLDLFRKGGDAILDAIEAQGFDVLKKRPEVSKGKKVRLLAGALVGKIRGVFS
ncbi:squalene synthase HpnC [Granulicella arctica]|uniref:Squalene synthase HpnC n=1 Tax=Granulicella arctica TaxID=940613 RepID=A0A7Y9PH93_9BACT|nr:squalene synthase HpnC [Granulicella arctica]NYF79868.1 squalene synthase HpnC [Granulicella arctica]